MPGTPDRSVKPRGLTDDQLRAGPIDVNVTGGNVTLDAGDISIGAVEIKDGSSNNRAAVSPAGEVLVDDQHPDPQLDGLTDTQLRASPVPVDISGSFPSSVEITNDVGNPISVNGTVAVTGTQTDGLTDAELRASPVDVLQRQLNWFSDQVNVTGSSVEVVATTPLPVEGPLTDAELRAAPVPVSGTLSVNEPVSVDDNGGSLTVDASNLDVRDLAFATDKVDVSGSTVTIQEPLSIDDNGGSITIDGSVGVTGDVTVVGKAADGAAVNGNPVLIAGQDGTNAQSFRTDTTGNAGVYPKAAAAALGDGAPNNPTVPLSEAGGVTGVQNYGRYFNGTDWDRIRGNTNGAYEQGNVAHDAVDAGNPVKVGGKARSSAPADVAASDRVDAYFDLKGRLATFTDVALPAGGNLIGLVSNQNAVYDPGLGTWVSLRGDATNGVDVDVTRLPADVDIRDLVHTADDVASVQEVGTLVAAGVGLTVKVAHLDMTTATTTDIVASVPSKKIRVLEYTMTCYEAITTEVSFARGAGTTRCTGSPLHRLTASVLPFLHRAAPTGAWLLETASGEALRVTQTAAADISVAIVYVEV